MTKRLFELATQSEWDALEESSGGHPDVAQAIDYLTTQAFDVVKCECPESLQHKKRESARQLASRKNFKIQTKFAKGWLYLKRVSDFKPATPTPDWAFRRTE